MRTLRAQALHSPCVWFPRGWQQSACPSPLLWLHVELNLKLRIAMGPALHTPSSIAQEDGTPVAGALASYIKSENHNCGSKIACSLFAASERQQSHFPGSENN